MTSSLAVRRLLAGLCLFTALTSANISFAAKKVMCELEDLISTKKLGAEPVIFQGSLKDNREAARIRRNFRSGDEFALFKELQAKVEQVQDAANDGTINLLFDRYGDLAADIQKGMVEGLDRTARLERTDLSPTARAKLLEELTTIHRELGETFYEYERLSKALDSVNTGSGQATVKDFRALLLKWIKASNPTMEIKRLVRHEEVTRFLQVAKGLGKPVGAEAFARLKLRRERLAAIGGIVRQIFTLGGGKGLLGKILSRIVSRPMAGYVENLNMLQKAFHYISGYFVQIAKKGVIVREHYGITSRQFGSNLPTPDAFFAAVYSKHAELSLQRDRRYADNYLVTALRRMLGPNTPEGIKSWQENREKITEHVKTVQKDENFRKLYEWALKEANELGPLPHSAPETVIPYTDIVAQIVGAALYTGSTVTMVWLARHMAGAGLVESPTAMEYAKAKKMLAEFNNAIDFAIEAVTTLAVDAEAGNPEAVSLWNEIKDFANEAPFPTDAEDIRDIANGMVHPALVGYAPY